MVTTPDSSGMGNFGIALAQLLDLALELSSERDLNAILKIATTGVCGAVGCERASLFIHDAARKELYTRVVTELEIAEIRHPLSRGIVGCAATERRMISVPIPSADPRWDSSVDRRTGFTTRNILAAPVLATDGRLLGVLQLLNKANGFSSLDERLLQAFAAHVAMALERRRLEEEAHRAWELRQSMEMGQGIQASFLPSSLPVIPGYDVAAWWQPAEFVSGDYYDWLHLPDGRWGFAIGDVSGHGLAAALIMTTVRAMSHVLARTATDVHGFVETLRESIASDLNGCRFITCCYALLDPEQHTLAWSNAGHAPSMVYRRRDRHWERLPPTAVPLGFPAVNVAASQAPLLMEPGDLLVLGTDGIVEVRNSVGEMYGTSRLMNLIASHAGEPVQSQIDAVKNEVSNFHGRPLPPDDMTLMIVQRTGKEDQNGLRQG